MRVRCNAHEINTGANNAYGKEEVYQEMKECPISTILVVVALLIGIPILVVVALLIGISILVVVALLIGIPILIVIARIISYVLVAIIIFCGKRSYKKG